MNLFSFFKKKSSLTVVFDIREFTLTSAVTRIYKNKKPEILYCQDFKIDESELILYKKYTASLLKTLDKGITEMHSIIQKMGIKEEIGQFFFFIGSPWVVSQSKDIKYTKDKEFTIDDAFLKRILVSQENNWQKNIEETQGSGSWELLEEKIIQAKLNGYKVDKIYDRKTKDIEIHLFTSFIPKEIINKLNSYIEEKFGQKTDQHSHSQTLSSFTFMRDLFPNRNNFIYIDIGKKITDIYVVREDIIHGISSFPFGEDAIIESVSKKEGLTKEIIQSLINIKSHGKCDEESERKVNNIIDDGLSMWVEKFNESIPKICLEKDVPFEIFIITNSDLLNLFVGRIKQENYNHPVRIYGKKPSITQISEGTFNNFIINGKIFKKQPFIKMDIILLDKLDKQKPLYA
ncbi:MAG: hypothetical protein WC631_00740 [Candidatus Paceibacterota bacterium]|jgi:hypothetical protein